MPSRSLARRCRLAATAALLAPALLLAGCSGDDGSSRATSSDTTGATSGSSSSSGETTKPYLPVPDGVELTAQGSKLDVGQHAVVAYEPRQDIVGALDIKVTALEKTSFAKSFQGWELDKQTLKTNPYFVHATIQNVGTSDLGGRAVPLYIVDGHNTLVEASTFASTFKPCPSTGFPDKFKHGDSVKACLVFLSPKHGDLTAVSFRPTQQFNPVTWTGELTQPGAAKSPKDGKSGTKQGEKKKQGGQG